MAIKYDLKENPFMEKDGKRILYPGVVVAGTWTTDDIVDTIAQRSSFSSGCVKG